MMHIDRHYFDIYTWGYGPVIRLHAYHAGALHSIQICWRKKRLANLAIKYLNCI